MLLGFQRECGRTYQLDTDFPVVFRRTADLTCVRVFADGYPVKLMITFENFEHCLKDPHFGISTGLCKLVEA